MNKDASIEAIMLELDTPSDQQVPQAPEPKYEGRHRRVLSRQERIWLLALYLDVTAIDAEAMMESVGE